MGKSFPARVYASGAELLPLEYLPNDEMLLVSDSVNWLCEFRCFILKAKVQTLSAYWRENELNFEATPQELAKAKTFAESVLETIPFPNAGVLDVGLLDTQEWAVIEANPAFASGIYACEPAAVLQVVQAACTTP